MQTLFVGSKPPELVAACKEREIYLDLYIDNSEQAPVKHIAASIERTL